MLLVLLEPRKGGADDEPTHRVSHHADLGNTDVFGKFVVHLCSQAHAHRVDVPLCPTFVR